MQERIGWQLYIFMSCAADKISTYSSFCSEFEQRKLVRENSTKRETNFNADLIAKREQRLKEANDSPYDFVDHLPPLYQRNLFRLYNISNPNKRQIEKVSAEQWVKLYADIKKYSCQKLPKKPRDDTSWLDNHKIMKEKRPDLYRKAQQTRIREVTEYNTACETKEKYDHVTVWIRDFINEIKDFAPGTRYCAMSESDLKETARQFSALCTTLVPNKAGIYTETSIKMRALILGLSIDPEDLTYILDAINLPDGVRHIDDLPDDDIMNDLPIRDPQKRRLFCQYAWRRRLRKAAKKSRQFWSANLRLTGGSKSPAYCDDYSVQRRKESDQASLDWSDDRFVCIPVIDKVTGEETFLQFSMTDVIRDGKRAALARLFGIIKGIEKITAANSDYVGGMITITLPACWHPNPSVGKKTWHPRFSPEKADKEIQRIWSVIRALLAARDIALIGMKVVEFHKDGCPHFHILFFVKWQDVATVDAVLLHARPEWNADDYEELLAQEISKAEGEKKKRTVFKQTPKEFTSKRDVIAHYSKKDKSRHGTHLTIIDPNKTYKNADGTIVTAASMSTYLFKYIVKSLNQDPKDIAKDGIDGVSDEETQSLIDALATTNDDHDSGDQITNFDRHRAAASERRIRRYSLIGVHGCQKIIQTIYKFKDEEFEEHNIPAEVKSVWDALHANDFATALTLLKVVKSLNNSDDERIRLQYEEKENGYGEINKVPVGLQLTRNKWSISGLQLIKETKQPIQSVKEPTLTINELPLFNVKVSDSWTMPLRYYDVVIMTKKELKTQAKLKEAAKLEDYNNEMLERDITVITTYPSCGEDAAQMSDLSKLDAHMSPDFIDEWEIDRNNRQQNNLEDIIFDDQSNDECESITLDPKIIKMVEERRRIPPPANDHHLKSAYNQGAEARKLENGYMSCPFKGHNTLWREGYLSACNQPDDAFTEQLMINIKDKPQRYEKDGKRLVLIKS